MNIEDIKEVVAAKYSEIEILDILDISPHDLLEVFEDKLLENIEQFKDIDYD